MELISREDAIKTARTMIGLTADEREDEIRAIPTIEERKEGHWIEPTSDMIHNHICGSCEVICSSCNETAIDEYNYCPNCGAKMYEDDKDIYVPNKGE